MSTSEKSIWKFYIALLKKIDKIDGTKYLAHKIKDRS